MDLRFLKIITEAIKKTIDAYKSLNDEMSKLDKEKLAAADRAKLAETAKIMKAFSVEGTLEYYML